MGSPVGRRQAGACGELLARVTMAVYLTKRQQDRKSAKGDKYLPHACARCGCGIRVTPGRTAGGSCHGDTGKARKVCDALLAARIREQGEEAEEDESEEDSEDRSAEQSEAEGSEEGEVRRAPLKLRE